MTMRKQAGQTKKKTTTAAHKTTRRSAGTKTAAKSTPSKSKSKTQGKDTGQLISGPGLLFIRRRYSLRDL